MELRTDIDPLARLLILAEKATRGVAVSDGPDDNSGHRRLLDLGCPDIIGAVQGHNVAESLVS